MYMKHISNNLHEQNFNILRLHTYIYPWKNQAQLATTVKPQVLTRTQYLSFQRGLRKQYSHDFFL